MAQNISILIIDSDKSSADAMEDSIKSIDRHLSLAGTASTLELGYDMIVRTRPMVVLLEIDSDPEAAMALTTKVLQQFPGTSIFATSADSSSENILRAMRTGCTEFLLRPVSETDLVNAFQKFGRIAIQQAAPARKENGKVITVFSPKGGIGTSTVSSNLAVCLHQNTGKPVVLIDLDLEAGDAAMFLNLKTQYSITDVTSNIARIDRSFLESVLAKHSSGIYLMAEPENVEDAGSITAAQVREVISILKNMFAYIVIDTGIGYGETNLAAFDSADLILLAGVLSLPTIRNIQKALDVFDRLGYGPEKVRLIFNRHLKKGEITLNDTKKALDYDIFWHIPNDFNYVMASINKGQPLSILAPNSEISKAFKDLATKSQEYLDGQSSKGGRPAMAAL